MSYFEDEAVDTTVENTPVEETVAVEVESDATDETSSDVVEETTEPTA